MEDGFWGFELSASDRLNKTFVLITFYVSRKVKFRQQQRHERKTFSFLSKHFLTDSLTDEEWEKDLAAEIQDFEVVDDDVDEAELDDLK